MIAPAASTFLVDSILVSSGSISPIGSESFTLSQPTGILSGYSLHTRGGAQGQGALADRAQVRVADLLDAFRACLANDLVWIEDFCDDQVEISRDLYEVLEAFAQVRREDIGENQ